MEPILQVEHISKSYTGHRALDDVSMVVPRGSVYGLLGPNGAGKTTLIRVINRITAPDAGRVLLDGHEVTDDDVRRIGYLPEERGLYKKMKVGEQAIFFARLKGLSRSDARRQLKVWFEKFGIESWWDRKVEELSKGMAQKVQFIITVLHRPELLIFDEPFSGFDPVNAQLLKDEIMALRDAGATVIFSTHNMSSVEEICDHITLIDKSHNILTGPVGEVRRRHGENVFEVSFRGDEQALRASVGGLCEFFDAQEQLSPECAVLRLRPVGGVRMREVIAAMNDSVELRGFTEVIPSMNDIFIRAVNGKL